VITLNKITLKEYEDHIYKFFFAIVSIRLRYMIYNSVKRALMNLKKIKQERYAKVNQFKGTSGILKKPIKTVKR